VIYRLATMHSLPTDRRQSCHRRPTQIAVPRQQKTKHYFLTLYTISWDC